MLGISSYGVIVSEIKVLRHCLYLSPFPRARLTGLEKLAESLGRNEPTLAQRKTEVRHKEKPGPSLAGHW